MTAPPHIPVMLDEVITALAPRAGEVMVDATFGAGGYSRAILAAGVERLIAFDRDPAAIGAGEGLADEWPGRLTLIESPFGAMAAACGALGLNAVDGVVFDFGVSSMQIDEAARGFSFLRDGPLDMRMGREGPTAADLLAEMEEGDLIRILRDYGEERRARRVAAAILAARETAPIQTTGALAELVEGALGRRPQDKIHPATRTFQALRIAVNDELGEITRGLHAAERLLKPGGRLVAVSFHSLEDRIVKRFLTERTGRTPQGSRHAPAQADAGAGTARAPSFEAPRRAVRKPSEAEAVRNPRARSARLRAAVRTAAAPWPMEAAA